MHLPGGVLDNLTCSVTTLAATGAIGYSAYRLRRDAPAAIAPKMAGTAAVIFAAQMVNFPVDRGVSGHLIGGLLAAAWLGPWAGLLAMSVVLAAQALLAGDGGLTTLGANVFNMGVIAVWGGNWLLTGLRRGIARNQWGAMAAAGTAAGLSVVLAAVACGLQITLSGSWSLGQVTSLVLPVHLRIAFVEAVVTCAVLGLATVVMPRLLGRAANQEAQIVWSWRPRQLSTWGIALALAVVFLLVPWASDRPDGLETALRVLVPTASASVAAAPLADYQMPGVVSPSLATALAGCVGALVVFTAAWLIGQGIHQRLSRA